MRGEYGLGATHVLLAGNSACLRQIPRDEVALRIYVRVNSVKKPKLMVHKFNCNVVCRRGRPERH